MQDALVNSDARLEAGPSLSAVRAAGGRVARTQTKYHRWAKADRETRFGDLFNLVGHPDYLLVAWDHVAHNKGARTAGVDGVTVRQILQRGEVGAFLADIAESLKDGTYQPAPVRRVMLAKPGGKSRPLGIPTVTDRVVQQSLRMDLRRPGDRRLPTEIVVDADPSPPDGQSRRVTRRPGLDCLLATATTASLATGHASSPALSPTTPVGTCLSRMR